MKSGRQPPQPCNIPKNNTEVRMGILFVDPILNFNHCKESQFKSHVMYPLAVTRRPVIWPATVDSLDWQNWPPGGQQWPTAVYPTVLQRDFDNWLWSLGRRPSRGKRRKRMEKGNMSQMTKQERVHDTKPEDLKRGCPFSWMKLSRPRCPASHGDIQSDPHHCWIYPVIQYIQYIYPCISHILAWTCPVDFHVGKYHADPLQSLMFSKRFVSAHPFIAYCCRLSQCLLLSSILPFLGII